MTASTYPSFFLVGTGRSGTTLLRTMLTGHSEVEIPGETGFLPRLLRLRPLWWGGGGLRAEPFVRLAFANGRLARDGLDQATVLADLVGRPCRSPQEAVSRLYEACVTGGAEAGPTLVGDKTPGYIGHLPLLTETFPQARVVQIVRHPLDVVASLRRQSWGPDDVRAGAMKWRLDQRRAERCGLGSDRLHVVRLEQLVVDPEAVLDGVARHLGLTANPGMLRFHERAERVIAQNVHADSHTGLREPLRTTSSWQRELDPDEAAEAWAVVAPDAERLGYIGPGGGPGGGSPGGSGALRAGRAWDARLRFGAFQASRAWRTTRTVRRLLWQ